MRQWPWQTWWQRSGAEHLLRHLALIKLILVEATALVRRLWDAADVVLSSLLVYPEARAALAAAARDEHLGKGLLRRAVQWLDGACDELELIGCDEALARMAGELSERYALRGYDAVHLASALSAGDERLLLATWDRELADATVAAGLAVAPAR